MSRGILKRNTLNKNTRDRRQQAEDNLMQIIQETLRGKSSKEQDDIMYEFIQYFNHKEGIEKGVNEYLRKVTRNKPKVSFSNNTRNRNNKLTFKKSNGMTKRRNAKNSVL